ncbi:alpha/beta fold hydrolase [Pseudomonas sp. CGJS7]|uniref:alpha/beta fold hydrolase n=1 Tax=Pseudomonas sp. CGJS7 TaxID=3109348 RepID=UPI0030086F77
MSLRTVDNQWGELHTQAFGDPSHPPVILVMGAMASMQWWPQAFCEALARADLYVIRYDQRDTGLSTHCPPGEPDYSLADLADDVFAIADAYQARAVHVVGMSMGGMVAQRATLARPKRVLSLSLISTSPLGIEGLPPMSAAYAEHSASGESLDWTDPEAVLEFMVRDAAAIASTAHPHDAEAMRAFIRADIARARGFASATNHFMLVDGAQSPPRPLSELRVPVLAIHGSSDPIFPFAHAEALVAAVDGARLVRIEGGGHELHPADWAQTIEAIATHTAGIAAPR